MGVLRVAVALLILKVTATVVAGYVDYLPANFDSQFLSGREGYFWDGYHIPFYAHIASGPLTLIIGLLLLNAGFLRRWPEWHRRLGRLQALLVLLLLTPSGLWMAFHAETGPVAGWGFGLLSIATAGAFLLGWRAAIGRRISEHRRWMLRVFVLLCSAVVLRLTNGLLITLDIQQDWSYPMMAWTSWLVPWGVLELMRQRGMRKRRITS